MKPTPYIMLTNNSPRWSPNPLEDAVAVPVCGTTLYFRRGVVMKAGGAGASLCEYVVGPDGTSVEILDLRASSAEEFWLKLSASGLICGEGDGPMFSDAEKEISRLRSRVAELESRIGEYRKAARSLSSSLGEEAAV